MHADHKVTLGCVAAVALWVLTVLFILAGTITAIATQNDVGLAIAASLMAHGLACSAGAATVTIRNGLKAQNRLIVEAYQLGTEHGTVRRVR